MHVCVLLCKLTEFVRIIAMVVRIEQDRTVLKASVNEMLMEELF